MPPSAKLGGADSSGSVDFFSFNDVAFGSASTMDMRPI